MAWHGSVLAEELKVKEGNVEATFYSSDNMADEVASLHLEAWVFSNSAYVLAEKLGDTVALRRAQKTMMVSSLSMWAKTQGPKPLIPTRLNVERDLRTLAPLRGIDKLLQTEDALRMVPPWLLREWGIDDDLRELRDVKIREKLDEFALYLRSEPPTEINPPFVFRNETVPQLKKMVPKIQPLAIQALGEFTDLKLRLKPEQLDSQRFSVLFNVLKYWMLAYSEKHQVDPDNATDTMISFYHMASRYRLKEALEAVQANKQPGFQESFVLNRLKFLSPVELDRFRAFLEQSRENEAK